MEKRKEKQSERNRMDNYSNDDIRLLIDKWIRGERNREILKRRLIDGICYEPLAEEFNLSVRHIKTIVYKNEDILFKHI